MAAVRIKSVTLTVDTVEDVVFDGRGRAFELTHVADVDDVVWVQLGPVDPTEGGDDCNVLLPGERVQFATGVASAFEVRLLSGSACTVVVAQLQ